MKLNIRVAAILFLFASLSGCVSTVVEVDPSKPIQFVDLPMFDEQVQGALRARPEQIKIELLDKVKPSQIPDRLRSWITTAQKAGGSVNVALAEGEIQPRGIPLLSLIPSIFGSLLSTDAVRPPAADLRGYDVKIQLKSEIGRAHV